MSFLLRKLNSIIHVYINYVLQKCVFTSCFVPGCDTVLYLHVNGCPRERTPCSRSQTTGTKVNNTSQKFDLAAAQHRLPESQKVTRGHWWPAAGWEKLRWQGLELVRGSHHPRWTHPSKGGGAQEASGCSKPWSADAGEQEARGGRGAVMRQGSRTGLPGTRQEGRAQSPSPRKRRGLEAAGEHVREDKCEEG